MRARVRIGGDDVGGGIIIGRGTRPARRVVVERAAARGEETVEDAV
jgi:hypothetical protein